MVHSNTVISGSVDKNQSRYSHGKEETMNTSVALCILYIALVISLSCGTVSGQTQDCSPYKDLRQGVSVCFRAVSSGVTGTRVRLWRWWFKNNGQSPIRSIQYEVTADCVDEYNDEEPTKRKTYSSTIKPGENNGIFEADEEIACSEPIIQIVKVERSEPPARTDVKCGRSTWQTVWFSTGERGFGIGGINGDDGVDIRTCDLGRSGAGWDFRNRYDYGVTVVYDVELIDSRGRLRTVRKSIWVDRHSEVVGGAGQPFPLDLKIILVKDIAGKLVPHR